MAETLLTPQRLTKAIFASRQRHVPERDADPTRYVKLWTEDDVAEWGPTKALVLIMKTRGCTWDYQRSCTMCGYFVDVLPKKIPPEAFMAQWASAERNLKDQQLLKIYTGGNFLDDAEVPPSVRFGIIDSAAPRVKRIVVETRPEYIRDEVVRPMVERARAHGAEIELALGLESSDRRVCDEAINKGYGLEEFIQGARIAHAAGARVKTYLLLKPPFLTEDEAVEDIVQSVRDAAPHSDILSINPTNVQKHTLVDRMHRRGEYRSPWLWSILECLQRAKPGVGTKVLKSDPVGGGTPRGAHNCGRCDERILAFLERYNATQDLAFVEAAQAIDCSCKARYRAVRELEGHLGGSMFVD